MPDADASIADAAVAPGDLDASTPADLGSSDVPADPDSVAPPQRALWVQALDPDHGPSEGLVQVVMMGGGFREGMEVFFGDLPVLDTFVLNQGAALVTTPPHPPGVVDVFVRHLDIEDGAPSTYENAYLYEANLQVGVPVPSEGDTAGGEPITLFGNGFGADARFFIAGKAGLDQQVMDEHTLTGLTPPGPAGAASIHVVTSQGVAVAEEAFLYRTLPTVTGITPISGPPQGDTLVTLQGAGLSKDAQVSFNGDNATVETSSDDNTTLRVRTPPGSPGALADISVSTPVGEVVAADAWAWQDDTVDSYVLSCSHLYPVQGSADGGTTVQLACWGLQYGATVTFDDVDAAVVDIDADNGLLTVHTPASEAGTVDVHVAHAFGQYTLEGAFTFTQPSPLTLTSLTPDSGPTSGGTQVAVQGTGFSEGVSVRFGSQMASSIEVVSATSLTTIAPVGATGPVTVTVEDSEGEATLSDAFTYTNGTAALHLIAPHHMAIAGGTRLRVLGDGFDDATTLDIDGEPCEVIDREGPTVLWVRSPALPVGTHDATLTTTQGTVTQPDAVSTYDPRTGYSGTWGGALQGSVNVTVYGVQGFGPIPGAFVYAARANGQAVSGYTNDKGQLTLSEPWLMDVIDVTATASGWSAYTITQMDAKNVTLYLRPTTPSPGTPSPIDYPPDAILSGQVIGLGKYVVPPAGACTTAMTAGVADCLSCQTHADCPADTHDCVDLLEQGSRCLRHCEVHADCMDGYVCAGFEDHQTRCMPSPGTKMAKCSVSASSVFSQDLYPPETGWVVEGESFELPSTRLGDIAIVCFGGYRSATGTFTPTALGVRRHVYATAGAVMEGLDVVLTHPLDRVFRFRLLEPPTWPTGIESPAITLSIDLGADGAIPMTRPAFSGANTQSWRVARQIGGLSGDLYDASYAVYTRISADSTSPSLAAYTFKRNIQSIVQARLPYRDIDGWHLDASGLEDDLHGLWAAPNGSFTAVGTDGLLLFHNGQGWYEQTSGTSETLYAVDGTAWDDQWAAGAGGALLHWGGIAWQAVTAPMDTYHALTAGPDATLHLAGDLRLRRRDPDGSWHLAGPPSLQRIRGLDGTDAGVVIAVGTDGRAFRREPGGSWSSLSTSVDTDLLAVSIEPSTETFVVAGRDGTLLVGSAIDDTLEQIELGTTLDLTAVARDGDTVHVVGEAGFSARRVDGVWSTEFINGYSSRAHAVAFSSTTGVTRVVGSASYVLGPFMGYPVLEAPVVDVETGALTLNWSFTSGAPAHYTRLNVAAEKYGPTFWTLIVGRGETSATLPDLSLLAGLAGLGSGSRSLEIQRTRNHDFDIDDYMSREFSIYLRESWSTDRVEFYSP